MPEQWLPLLTLIPRGALARRPASGLFSVCTTLEAVVGPVLLVTRVSPPAARAPKLLTKLEVPIKPTTATFIFGFHSLSLTQNCACAACSANCTTANDISEGIDLPPRPANAGNRGIESQVRLPTVRGGLRADAPRGRCAPAGGANLRLSAEQSRFSVGQVYTFYDCARRAGDDVAGLSGRLEALRRFSFLLCETQRDLVRTRSRT